MMRIAKTLGMRVVLSACLSTGWMMGYAADRSVTIINASRPTQCAEEDNVYIKLLAQNIRHLTIEARQPSYIDTLKSDRSTSDFSHCHFNAAPPLRPADHPFAPRQIVLWESENYLMIGNTYATFWRPQAPDIEVNGQHHADIHLIQLFLKDKTEPTLGRHEFLVLYPSDGYWRAKPIPALSLNDSVYGSSFLVGPITDAERPFVELTQVRFSPETMSFSLSYADGSQGLMKIARINRERITLHYTHDREFPTPRPLAAIRSMYVSPDNADVAEVSFRTVASGPLIRTPLSEFTEARVQQVNFGRSQPSRHNTSAPDIWFGNFKGQ
ncbi:hypothetical protein HX882_19605 [Pseudomonas gingeri]|uniref:Uncharacterized protein n=1 Tax=Pseudomonas gingeri TaxID=117681 RepID=A0A7Y7XE08_9PSED|nr:hypothetical protein [Pseudomonas gingeri]NWB98107.1 hypothetical protein [Pseudomonas gingeri]